MSERLNTCAAGNGCALRRTSARASTSAHIGTTAASTSHRVHANRPRDRITVEAEGLSAISLRVRLSAACHHGRTQLHTRRVLLVANLRH